ncbi:MAG: MerR family transcriptional regulator [Ginsengibacter sp.]|jgi:DNA-binding transcriptional MerR regulator
MDIKYFTIKDMERFSGIKAHTLRAWEHRYDLLKPARGSGNYRLYTLNQLKKILQIALLKKNGFRISFLSIMSDNDLEQKLKQLNDESDRQQLAINDLIINMYSVDPESFQFLLDELLFTWAINMLVEKVLFPFLKITNLLWIGHKRIEEHLVVTAIRKKLILAIETLTITVKSNKRVLLFLPDTKQLDLGLLYGNYYLKRRGVQIIYLGNDITIQNLKTFFYVYTPAYLFTYLPNNNRVLIKELLDCISLYDGDTKLVIGEYSLNKDHRSSNDKLIQINYEQALDFLYINAG